MKRALAATLAGIALALPLAATAAPDETQKQIIQRAQEAKRKLAAAEKAQGADRQQMMMDHMKMMDAMMAQMQKSKPPAGMKPEQMREWIDEHMKLMQEMMAQMKDSQRMMMQGGMGGGMMGGGGMGKK